MDWAWQRTSFCIARLPDSRVDSQLHVSKDLARLLTILGDSGLFQVYAKRTKDGNVNWLATEGVYYPVPGSEKDEEGEL